MTEIDTSIDGIYDPNREMVSTFSSSRRFMVQEPAPIPDRLREWAPFLAWPEQAEVSFYCDGNDGIPTQVNVLWVELDPEANHGYVKAQVGVPHGGYPHVMALAAGEMTYRRLVPCPKCEGSWAVHTQEAYGDRTVCDCGHDYYFSIGD